MEKLVRNYLNFEEIKTVIDIDTDLKDDGGKALVEKYVISENIKGHLINISENLSKTKHKSIQIVGSYGSGKSHLLAFLITILKNRENICYIQNQEIKNIFEKNITRDFVVVQFELSSIQKDLGEIFYYRVREQLKNKYGIEIPKKNYSEIIDHKQEMDEILNIIKVKNPELGLVVVIDEISDFMKGKNQKADKVRDTQFLRVMAQKSQDSDFLMIGAMQEQIFTNAEFIDDAEQIGRVYERFDVITISREDIKSVVSNRMLKKTEVQKIDLEEVLEDFSKQIPSVGNRLDEFINLYPVHPYVIDIFNDLPVFEMRGVIQFVTDNVSKILGEPQNTFITFDRIYDQIASIHTMKHLDEIAPIVDAVNTLESKVNEMRSERRGEALKIIKSLAILKIYGKTQNNGATLEEIASNLMIISQIKPAHRVKVILEELREKTDGQFISESNSYYHLDSAGGLDYKLIIKRKSENLPSGAANDELLKFISDKFNLNTDGENIVRVITETCRWAEKNSYREGFFIFDDGETLFNYSNGDFNFVYRSPLVKMEKIDSNINTGILIPKYDENIFEILKTLAATNFLMREGKYPKSIIQKYNENAKKDLEKKLSNNIIESEFEINGDRKKVKDILETQTDELPVLYDEIKKMMFQGYFNEKYPSYPKFANIISQQNLRGEMDRTIKNILKASGMEGLSANDKGYLRALGMININGEITLENSLYVKNLLNLLKLKGSINVDINEVRELFKKNPYGLQEEIIDLMLFFVTYNGQINLVKIGGGDIGAAELVEFFGKDGYKVFNNIKYVKQEIDTPVAELKKLFKVVGINEGLMNSKDNRVTAVQEFKAKILTLEDDRKYCITKLEELSSNPNLNIYQNHAKIHEKLDILRKFKLDKLLSVNNPMAFKNIILDDIELQQLDEKIKILGKIKEFMTDFSSTLRTDYIYMKESYYILEDGLFDGGINLFNSLYKECRDIMEDFDRVLDSEERRQLRGKLQQYKQKYQSYYFTQHQHNVGPYIEWEKLDEIKKSQEYRNLRSMKSIKGINGNSFRDIEEEILRYENLRCEKLSLEDLDNKVKCPYCNYPEISKNYRDISKGIKEIIEKIQSLSKEWEKRILEEIDSYKDNLKLLDSRKKATVEKIISENNLPEIDNNIIETLNELFKDIEEKELNAEIINNILFCDGEILTFKGFEEKLENLKRFVKNKVHDIENLRIKKS